MDEFWQTFLIATIPSIITALLYYLAALKASNTQIKVIKEQNESPSKSEPFAFGI